MTKQRTIFLILAIFPILCGGCTRDWVGDGILHVEMPLPVVHTEPNDPPPPPIIRDVTHVDIESFGGDVVISVDPTRESLDVSLRREADFPWGREKEEKGALEAIKADVQEAVDESGHHLTIRATTSSPEPYYQRAHLLIQAPAIGNVKVQTSHGKVYVTDFQGSVEINNNHGDVRLMTSWPITSPITVINSDGSVDYRVRAESRGDIDAQTVFGSVLFRQTYGKWAMKESASTQHRLRAVLNDGVNPVMLRTSHGDIRIAIVSNPTEVGHWIVQP